MYKNSEQIAILMSTYNGGKFIGEQLESLFQQSVQTFHLYIRDDGSTDDTLKIVSTFIDRFPHQITLVQDSATHCGPAKSFMTLLENVDSEYYMFCDQDDVWFPTKIEHTFAQIKALEKEKLDDNNDSVPVLVATDLQVVDASLNLIDNSFNKDLKIDVFRKHPQLLCIRHVVTGCTAMFNKAAKKVSLPFSPLATMHDEWIALKVFFNKGIVYMMDEATISYRQHSGNEHGASQATTSKLKRCLSPKWRKQFFSAIKLLHKEFKLPYIKFIWYKILYSWTR